MKIKISNTAIIHPDVSIGKDVFIGDYSIIGRPYRLVFHEEYCTKNKTKIEKGCQIGSHVVIGRGSSIGENTNIEDFCKLEQDVENGKNCHIIYASQLCNNAIIGDNCIIAAFICERAKIGNNSRIFGKLIHSQINPLSDWDDTIEPSPLIGDNVFVGFDAKVIGDVKIGSSSYICSGAIITKNIPSYHIGYDVNKIMHYTEWKGSLRDSDFFRRSCDD